jgi:uncharacterized protein with HEPN domain
MPEAARQALAFAAGKSRADLDASRQLVLALVKLVEIVGEAASQVSRDAQQEVPSVPWRDMVAMRRRLVHAYFDINLDVVWSTVVTDLPALIGALETVPGLAEEPPAE